MAKIYVISYYESTGEIWQVGEDDDTTFIPPTWDQIPGVDTSDFAYITVPTWETGWDLTKWVNAGVLEDRLALSLFATWDSTTLTADGVDTVTLGPGLPANTVVIIETTSNVMNMNGAPRFEYVTVPDGSFTFATNIPGTYTIRTQGVSPYLPSSTEIIAS